MIQTRNKFYSKLRKYGIPIKLAYRLTVALIK